MATWNKTESWKSFYQKKKPELKTKYPFLKEYQIREKAKKSWNQNKRRIFKDKVGPCDNDETIEGATKQVVHGQVSSDSEEEVSCDKRKPMVTGKPILRRYITRRSVFHRGSQSDCMKETNTSCVNSTGTSTRPHVYVCNGAIDKYIEVEETDTGEGPAVDLCDSCTMNEVLENDIVGIVDSNESDFECNNGHPHNDNGCRGDDHHGNDDEYCQAVHPLKGESVLEMFRPNAETMERDNITTGKSPISKRRVFVSSAEESNSNFHTLFTDDCDIFM